MCNRSLRLSRVVGISGEFFMQTKCEISVLNAYLPLYIYLTKSLLISQDSSRMYLDPLLQQTRKAKFSSLTSLIFSP